MYTQGSSQQTVEIPNDNLDVKLEKAYQNLYEYTCIVNVRNGEITKVYFIIDRQIHIYLTV